MGSHRENFARSWLSLYRNNKALFLLVFLRDGIEWGDGKWFVSEWSCADHAGSVPFQIIRPPSILLKMPPKSSRSPWGLPATFTYYCQRTKKIAFLLLLVKKTGSLIITSDCFTIIFEIYLRFQNN